MMLDRLEAILAADIPRVEAALEAAQRDSRLGYEAEMDYVYTPYVIEEKLRLLRQTQAEILPRLRREAAETSAP